MHVRTERQNLWYDVLTENSRRAAATTTTDESIGKVTARVLPLVKSSRGEHFSLITSVYLCDWDFKC